MPKRVGDAGPTNPTAKRRDEFEDFERDQWKRPRIPAPGKSGRKDLPRAGYTRSSSLGGVLEDQYNLGQWRMRMVAFGLSRRKDLHLAVQSLPAPDADKKALGDLCEKALEAAESSAKATIGTAIHALTEQVDQGVDVSHVSGETREALDAWVSLTAGFEVLAIEARVVCDEHKVAGTFDRLFRTRGPMTAPDGTRVPEGTPLIGDLKTSGSSAYFGIKFAVQLAEYAHGVPFNVVAYERRAWETIADNATPNQQWGLIVHIPTGAPEEAGLYWVDLESGRELSELALAVKAQRNRRDLVVPASAPAMPDVLTASGLLSLIRAASSRAAIDDLWRPAKRDGRWNDLHTQAAKDRLVELAAQQGAMA